MGADVFTSTAAKIGVRLIDGYQSGCNDESCDDGLGRVHLGDLPPSGVWVRWCGPFRETWIDAALDAVLHNIETHGYEYPKAEWPVIVHG